MMLPLQDHLRARVRTALSTAFGLDAQAVAVPLETPPTRALGDLGTPIAFELARTLRKAPRVIAQELAAALGTIEGVERVVAAPNGYLNLFLDRSAFLRERLRDGAAAAAGGKTIVEHTAINPNKAAHIGHLRNACLGDTLVRALRFRGTPVEVQNYIDDTGVQVADVVVGFRHLEGRDLDGVRQIADTTRFDYYCWDLYARVTEWYDEDKARLAVRAETLHDIEHNTDPSAAMGAFIADRIVRTHLVTMARLGIDYDLLTWEGDILRLQFWARAFALLKEIGAVFLQEQGKLAGCWVMRIEDDPAAASGEEPAPQSDDAEAGGEEPREKVIVRSNGTVTYVGKDMAYQFWKSGLLGRDFHYRHFATHADGSPLWATTSRPDAAVTPHPAFGGARATYNVIDVRQSYLQKLLKQALVVAGHAAEAERLTHFSYEMVALSHATARELGFAPPAGSEEATRPFVEVSGRKGLGVKADDLLDRMIGKAATEVGRRNPDLAPDEVARTAELIGVAAVRYFMVKYSRTKVIAFDIDEALSFEGESGPYLQYAVVRAQNIWQKLRDRDGVTEAGVVADLETLPPTALTSDADGAERLWGLVLDAARLDEIVDQAVRTLEFGGLAKFAFGLAQTFNAVYHASPILAEERREVRYWRAAAIAYVRRQLTDALGIMGIGAPVRM